MNYKKYITWSAMATMVAMGLATTSCADQPDKFELADGVPSVSYVRMAKAASRDSLITGAYMSNAICIVGDNLRSVKQIDFNDQTAVLNTSYITDNTILLDVPKEIPNKVTNKMYLITASNDTVAYDFKVLVPKPEVKSISCEWARPGDEVTIYGDYLLDDENVPLTIAFAGGFEVSRDLIKKITKTAVTFEVPEGAPAGYINVTSIYGTGRSHFQYKDTRGMMFDWDGSHGGFATGHGWRNGVIKSEGGIDGSYLYFGGMDLSGEIGASWAEDNFSFNYWPEAGTEYVDLYDLPQVASVLSQCDLSDLQLKFEINVPSSNPWQTCALQMVFTSEDVVTYTNATNGFFGNAAVPRGLWAPWTATGSYDTGDQWLTVSLPLSEFTKDNQGLACANAMDVNSLAGLSFFVWHGGVAGTDCSPVILIDNIRVVPIE